MAASQWTMNNFTFGYGAHQYYETISGGSGAGIEIGGSSVAMARAPSAASRGQASCRRA